MNAKIVEIDGQTFNLGDPEEKKAAIQAWLKAKTKQRLTGIPQPIKLRDPELIPPAPPAPPVQEASQADQLP